MKVKYILLGFCIIAAMMLTACEVGVTTKINADGSGEMGVVMKYEKAEADALASMGLGSADSLCSSMSQSGGTGLTSEDMQLTQETHGNQIWCVGSKPFAALSEMVSQSDSSFKINKAEIANGKFNLDADLDFSSASSDMSSLSMIQASGYSLTMYYEIVAPGNIDKSKSTGWDSINGNTARLVIMQIDKQTNKVPTGPVHITLQSNTKGGSSSSGGGQSITSKKVGGVPVWGIIVAVCCCLLLIVIIVVAVFFFMRRKPKQPAM